MRPLDLTGWALAGGMTGCPPAVWGTEAPVCRQEWQVQVTQIPLVFSFCIPNSLATADSTGTHSLYTTYQDHEIMFHVSTMLPYTPNNQQQV